MLYIHNLREGLPLFRALSAPTRVAILELLYQQGPLPMGEIGKRLELTAGALSPHIKQLQECGLVHIDVEPGRHGLQKVCSVREDRIVIDPAAQSGANVFETELGVGQYVEHEAYPTCGLATTEALIGEEDDPRYFAAPERVYGAILWLCNGYVEYMIPNFLRDDQQLVEIQISMEIASEAPGTSEEWPSDIYFSLNGKEVGMWTSPSDFGVMRGIYTPPWWNRHWNQHGLFKLLSINSNGTFIDGIRISEVRLSDLSIQPGKPLRLRIATPRETEHSGGLTLYGRGFGNYDQGIGVRMHYHDRAAVQIKQGKE